MLKRNILTSFINCAVNQYSLIDLDIKQIEILVNRGALKPAKSVFLWGHNSRKNNDLKIISGFEFNSLDKIGRDPTRSNSDHFSLYSDFYKNRDFSVSEINELFKSHKQNGHYSYVPFDGGRSQIFAKMSQYFLMMTESMKNMNLSVEQCVVKQDMGEATRYWDLSGASMIGSSATPSSDIITGDHGQLMLTAMKLSCVEFRTCDVVQSSSDESIFHELSQGLNSISAEDCKSLIFHKNRISSIFFATLFQNAIHYTQHLSFLAQGASTDVLWSDVADWYTSSLSILPLINSVDEESAEKLYNSTNKIFSFHPADGINLDSEEFIETLKSVIPRLTEYMDCNDVGEHKTYGNFCGDSNFTVHPNNPSENDSRPPKNESTTVNNTHSWIDITDLGLYTTTTNVDDM